MSSHHIIREKQEPALVLHDLDNINMEYLGQLLEWSPTIVALEKCLEATDIEGIKVDYSIIHPTNLDKWQSTLQQGPVTFSTSDSPSIYDAIKLLTGKGHEAVNIIGDNLTIEDFKGIANAQLIPDISLIRATQKVLLQHSNSFKKWYTKGEKVQVLSLGNELAITSRGFESNVQKLSGKTHEFQTCRDGEIELTSDSSSYLIVENL